MIPILVLTSLAAILLPQTQTARIVKQSLTFSGKTRQYAVYDPGGRKAGEKAPLVITLHGDRGDGYALVEAWRPLADREGIVVIGPISDSGRGWDVRADAPDFFEALVDIGVAMHGVDERRVYLFGHSAGGHFALTLGVLEPEYFAAVAAHAGVVMSELAQAARTAERRIPILLIAGRTDPVVPLDAVRASQKGLMALGWPEERVRLHVVNNDHNYRRISNEVNRLAWEALSRSRLEEDPKFKRYAR